jgi:two-component system, NarL family, invasion response regulator UvrY
MNDDPVLASQAIEAGARGYATNKDGPALFSSAVRSVAEGAIFLRPEIAREIAFIRASAKAAKISDLKPREIKVLRLLAAGWSMAEIAAETNLSYRTVANSCTRLKQRLGAPSMADLVRVALEWRL